MKLVRIFSNKNFKNVKFNEHFNAVVATIHDKANKKDTHNLGKTSLIHVIDFILLGKFAKGKGLLGNQIFYGQIFYLEILLNNGKYLIIRRCIDTPSKISFKLNDYPLLDFMPPTIWDKEDIGIDEKENNAKEVLNEYLGFDVFRNYDYRKSITYFLRTQQDYLNVFQLEKFNKNKQSVQWKPFVFELLGFNGEPIKKKLDLEQQAKEQKNRIAILQQEANVDIKEKDKILGLIDIKKREQEETSATIDKFNFYFEDKNISKEIIDDLDFKIQTLNTDRYRIEYEIAKTEESLRDSTNNIDLAKLKELYNEVQLYFPAELSKQYDELEQFNTSISNERRKYLAKNLQELKIEFNAINIEIENLEKSKSEKLSFLTEKDTFAKFKTYQKQLSMLESEIYRLNEKLKFIDKSVEIEDKIKEINEQITDSIYEITEELDTRKHADIQRIFNEILTEIVGTNALISMKQNTQGNVEFSADYINPVHKGFTSEAEGTSYKKLLCMAFDLSLLINYSRNSFFRFAYHDGILEGLDRRIKIRLLEKIKSICTEYNLQHIISLIDSDIPTYENGTMYEFSQNEICLELDDLGNNGKLFLQSF